jgi:serine/threonine-protein kinase
VTGAVPGTLREALADRYRLDRALGAGGMATVWLAHDLRHDRDVAIKVIHPDLGAALGGERFLAEIRTTARLQHPHVLPLLDSGDAGDGLLYYVMPFVRGETLRDRLERERQLPIDDALRIAREVADALQHAHAQGIIHRDIKPENILLQDGHALVADFGIALAVQQAAGQRMTQTGLSLGTPQYMSPEQSMGERTLDARSDVYALGAVTYEMLAGEAPFTGPTVQVIVAKVMSERPVPLATIRDTVPAHVEAAVLRALAKLPADRWATARDYAVALAATARDTGVRPRAGTTALPRRARSARVAGGAALAALAGGAGWLGRGALDATSASPLGAFGTARLVAWEPGVNADPALSPDGRTLAYTVGNGVRSRIWLRPVTGGRAVPLTDDSSAVEWNPRWARDGSRVLFLSDFRVASAPAGGGAARIEAAAPAMINGAAWSPDAKRLAYVVGTDTLMLREADGTVRRIAVGPGLGLCDWSTTELLACVTGNGYFLTPGVVYNNSSPSRIVTVRVRDGAVHDISDGLASNQAPRWSADGRWLYYASTRAGSADLWAQRITADGAADGAPVRLTVGLGVHSFSLDATGTTLAYSLVDDEANVWSVPFGDAGVPAGAVPRPETVGQQVIEDHLTSLDGRWLYYDASLGGRIGGLYRVPLAGGAPERLRESGNAEFAPAPSPDGREIAYHAFNGVDRDIFVLPLDGSPARSIGAMPGGQIVPRWSPDGRTLAFGQASTNPVTWLARRDAGGRWTTRVRMTGANWPSWSPDGRFLSVSEGFLGGVLSVIPTDSGPPRRLYDATRPGAPLALTSQWSPDGRTIWFKSVNARGEGRLYAVPSAGGEPRELYRFGDETRRSTLYDFEIAQGRLWFGLRQTRGRVWVMDIAPGGGR